MLVVADSSPINVLVRLACIDLLPTMFERVLVPPAVVRELSHRASPAPVREFINNPPAWLVVQAPTRELEFNTLDPGEIAAIILAIEAEADALLIDDLDGRREATRRGLLVIGTLGILERAGAQRLIDFRAITARLLRETDFRIDPRLVDNALARDEARRAGE